MEFEQNLDSKTSMLHTDIRLVSREISSSVGILPASVWGGIRRRRASSNACCRLRRVHASSSSFPLIAVGESSDMVKQYNQEMAEKMGWNDALKNPYEYHPERGIYYHYILEDVLCGSQPRSPDDIAHIAIEEDVRAILNMQADRDLHHWGVDLHSLQQTAKVLDVAYLRTPAADFNPHSLRATLPGAVAALERARLDHGRVYVHCTAGLGRAPGVVIAALYWFSDLQLDDAYEYLTQIRPCGPNRDAIRGATYDLLSGRHWDGFTHEPSHAFATLSSSDKAEIRSKLLGDS